MATEKSTIANADVHGVASGKAADSEAMTNKPVAGGRPSRKKSTTKASATVKAPATAAAVPSKGKKMPAAEKLPSPKPATVSKAKPAEALEKVRKDKLVRDSFTMPATEYAVLAQLKKRCLANGVAAKKSEVLRAALATLSAVSDDSLLSAIAQLEVIKTGRPKGKK